MNTPQSNNKSWWRRLLGGTAPKPRKQPTSRLCLEHLEDRLTPSTFSDVGTQLNLVLAGALQTSINSNGTSYTISQPGQTWSGTDDANVTGSGTSDLTITSAGIAAFTGGLNFTDSAPGSTVAFIDSGANSYSNNFSFNLLDDPSSPALRFFGASTFAGNSSLTGTVDGTVLIRGATITTANGDFNVNGTGNVAAPTGDFAQGILMDTASTITSTGSGNITLVGTGDGSDINENAVFIYQGSQVVSSGSGAITITGTSPSTSSTDTFGVFLTGPGTQVRSVSGAINITGTALGGVGGGDNAGVLIQSAAVVQATGSASISITGTGSTVAAFNNPGIAIDGTGGAASVTTANGAITLHGTGGSTVSDGIAVSNGAVVHAGGAGAITATGSSVGGGSGVRVTGNAFLTSTNGAISLTGAVGPSGSGVGGVEIDNGGQVTSTSGAIGLTGYGNNTNPGAYATGAGSLVHSSGTISITGTGGGVNLANGATVSSAAAVTLTATDTAANSDSLALGGSLVQSTGGNVYLQAGDGLSVDSTSSALAAGMLILQVDYGNADPGLGASMSLSGATLTSGLGTFAFGGPDDDTFTLVSTHVTGNLTLDGGGGNDACIVSVLTQVSGTFLLNDQPGQGTDSLQFRGSNAADSFVVNATQIQGNGLTINYTAALEMVTILSIGGNDTFSVTPSPTALIVISAGVPIAPSLPGDTLAFTTPAGQTSTNVGGLPNGTYHTTGGYQDVQYTSIETLGVPNQPPVNVVPVSLTADEDVPLAITGISVSDPDAGSASIQMTLSVLHGSLLVATNVAGGLAAGNVSGNGSGSVVLTGSQTQINATLAGASGLIYTPTTGYFGADTLTVSSNDLGNTGTGGPQIDVDAVPITVLSTLQEVSGLIALVQQDMAAGILSNGQGTSMINSALKQVTATTGIADMDKFIGDVQKLVQQGKLSQANADPLLSAALLVRQGLTS